MDMVTFLCIACVAWQQHVSYRIDARLDTMQHTLRAQQVITYFNNAPVDMETLYFHLYPNAYKNGTTTFAQEMTALGNPVLKALHFDEQGFLEIRQVLVGEDTLPFFVSGTLMSLPLPDVLRSGDSCVFAIDFLLKIPKQVSRLGYQQQHYEITQWYPKPCVYDDEGWHCSDYHAIGEFFGEYGDFDVTLDIPGDYVITATGERCDSIDIAMIESLIVRAEKPAMSSRRMARFSASCVHDFAWICDPDYHVQRTYVDDIAVYVFYLKHHTYAWRNAATYAVEAVQCYNEWFGQYPYANLNVVDGYFAGGMEYPQLVLIGASEDRFTRLFELVIVHEIAHQWFYGVLGSNEIDEAWLDEGFASYAELRFFEDKYGEGNSLLNLPFFPPLSRRYFHQVVYYITHTNELEKPILTSSYNFIDVPLAYQCAMYSKSALLLIHLEGVVGREVFDRILQRYVQEYRFRHPTTDDFIQICNEESGESLGPLIRQVLHSTDVCDWRIVSVHGRTVEIENDGTACLPVDVYIESEKGSCVQQIEGSGRMHTMVLPESTGVIKKVTIDPRGYSLEVNYWNNYYPPKIQFTPIYSLPSLDAYQIRWFPYLWYSSYDGVMVGLYLGGAQFVDFDVVKGKHQWVVGCIYGFRSKSVNPLFYYQTPIAFQHGLRTRIAIQGSARKGEDSFSASLMNNIGVPFSTGPQTELISKYSYSNLTSYAPVDTIDWELGVLSCVAQRLLYSHVPWQLDMAVEWSHSLLGSSWNYTKFTTEISCDMTVLVPCRIRFYAGKIVGTPPPQQQLFLSGKLRITTIADLIFGQSGYFSPQEHVHIPGDGNMRGYQTLHIRSNQLYSLNLEFPMSSPIRLFADVGYNDDLAFDAGARIVVGPVSLNFPMYVKSDQPWALRWSIGF